MVAAVGTVALLGSMLSASTIVRRSVPDAEVTRRLVAEAPDAATAVRLARAQGSRVEAVDLRTQTRAVYAEPHGSMTAELSARPVRVKQGGTWAVVDTTLVRRPDGSIGPRAATVDLSLSGGGSVAALVAYGKDGKRIALSWPGELPVPSLSGNAATYAEVLPGVDLVLRAAVDGYAQYLVIKNPEAARNPAVARVRFGLRTDGLRVRTTDGGGLEARDAAGAVVFAAPPSQMWDSSATPRRAIANVAVDGGSLTLSPDRAMLADPATTFPVTVDPDWHTFGWIGWTSTLSGKPNDTHWNSSGAPPWAQVGNCYNGNGDCNGIGVAWSYFQYNTGFLAGTTIISAELKTVMAHGPQCSAARNHQFFIAAGQIHPGTTWNNRPPGGLLDTRSVPGCGPAAVGFNTFGSIHINDGGGISTYFIKAENDGDQLSWRRYDSNQTYLVVNFNRRPNPPYNVTTQPPLAACAWCGGIPYVGDDFITLQANLSDNDPGEIVHPVWQIYRDGVRQDRNVCPCQASGSVFTTSLDLRGQDRKHIEWGVEAHDGRTNGDGGSGPKFRVDRNGVTKEPTISALLYKEDNRWHGGVGVPDTVTFTANDFKDPHGVNDIDHYLWGTTDPPATKVNAVGTLGGDATITFIPTRDGPQDLYVQMVDRAGHRGPKRVFHFYVRAGNGALAQYSFEGSTSDDAYLGDRHGTAVGSATYTQGAVGSAIHFDGQPGPHVSAPNAIHTDTSFSVSAWVRPDLIPAGGVMGVVGQEGSRVNSFYLNARGDTNKWTFMVAGADVDNPTAYWAVSPSAPVPGTWTHLTGVYDRRDNKIRLYVNGVRVSETALPAGFVAFDAAGRLIVGRERWNGMVGNSWHGSIDEVQVYDRVLSDADVRAAVGRDNVQAAYWKFDETEGSTARNAVAGGDMAVLANGASFTGPTGGAIGGAVRLDGVDDHVTTSGPVVRTDHSFTVAAWVKLDRLAAPGAAVTVVSQDGNTSSGLFLQQRDGRWMFGMPDGDGVGTWNVVAASAASSAQPNTWVHLAAVLDARSRRGYLYVNGALAGSDDAANPLWNATGSFAIGRGKWGGNVDFAAGLVDEVRGYTRELSAEEIRGIVARGNVTAGSWKLDGNATDSSGRGLNGTLNGAPDWTGGQTSVPDSTDLAVRLNGTGAHVSAGHAVDVDRSFSVTAWARPDRFGALETVLSQDGNRVSSFKLRSTPDGHWSFVMFNADADNGGTRGEVVGSLAQIGVWSHLAASYDATSHRLSLHVNGVLSGTASYTHPWNYPAGGLQIGRARWNGAPVEHFPGAIDDVHVYGRVLFAEEIRTMAGRDLSLVHNWPLDEPSGLNAADAVGARAGTLSGGAGRVPGRLGNAVSLDGVNDAVSTAGVDVDTRTSFTVATWVNLHRTCDPGAGFACRLTAVSLDGGQISKLRLGHVVDNDQNPFGAWVFEMPESDGTVTKAAVSAIESDLFSWVHLVGVYDAPARQIWLYVNATRQGDGTLDTPWHAAGGLQIGRGRGPTGAAAEHWPGEVDDVRLYTGLLDKNRIANLYASYPAQAGTPTLPTADAGYWTFDEHAGTTAADSSGRGLTATLRGGAGWIGGRTGPGAWFDGTSGYAETAGPVINTAQSFSVAAWAYLTAADAGSGNRVVVGQDGSQVSSFYLLYNVDSRTWEAVVPTADRANPTVVVVRSSRPALVGQWTHVALAYDANLDQLRLYVNGVLSAAQVGVTTWSATGPLSIGRGRWNGVNSGFFPRGVDDVRVFARALSDGEMRKVHDDTQHPPIGFWRFDDGTVRDYTWRNNPTTASGTVSFPTGISGQALQLDGASGSAAAQWWAASPQDSFTVSAWVRLAANGRDYTVLGQDGSRMSGFVLQYRRSLDRWVFGAPTQDADGAPLVYAYAPQPAVLNQWTYLAGVHDHAARQLRLYVNGTLVGTKDGVTLPEVWGGFTIGRGRYNGVPADFFAGAIDEVRTDMGMVGDSEIARRAGYPQPAPGQLGRFVNDATGEHYSAGTGDPVREGYRFERSLGAPVAAAGVNTRMLYGCRVGTDHFTSTDAACEGAVRIGEVGLVYTVQPINLSTVTVYRCRGATGVFDSLSSGCEGVGAQEVVLGYAPAYARLARYYSQIAIDHISTTYDTPPGYRYEGPQGWLAKLAQAGTRPLMGCRDGSDHFVSVAADCEGKTVLGTFGHIWTAAPEGLASAPLYQCVYSGNRFVSGRADCEGTTFVQQLGFVLATVPDTTPAFPAA